MKQAATLIITTIAIIAITILAIVSIEMMYEPYIIIACITAIAGLSGYNLRKFNNQK